MSKRILVTGATGFVGSHLCHQALTMGWDVYGLKRDSSSTRAFDDLTSYYTENYTHEAQQLLELKKRLVAFSDDEEGYTPNHTATHRGTFTWIDCDLHNKVQVLELLEQPYDMIIHTAAQISFDKKKRDQTIQDNVNITRNVVNACLIHKQQKLVHVSSIAALGRPVEKDEIDINTSWSESSYNTGYALSKHLSEMEVWRGAHEGLSVLVVNPGVILGYSMAPNSSKQVIGAATGNVCMVPMGSNGFVFVEDLAYRTLNLTQNSQNWNCRHLMVSHNIPFLELFLTIQEIHQIKPVLIKLQQPLWGILWTLLRAFELLGISVPVSSELLKSTRKISRYVNRKGATQSIKMA
jgi:dihydroflavonol-4-reductase